MSDSIVTLALAALGSTVVGSFVTYLFTRRKVAAETKKTSAEAASEEVETERKERTLVQEMRSENVDLYKRNIELEKANTDQVRTIEILTARLEARDQQLATLNKQMERLSSLAEQAPITETLRTQLDAVNKIAAGFQTTQSELQRLLIEKEKTLQELSQTNRDLEMRKPPRS